MCPIRFQSHCVKWDPCYHGIARAQVADGGEGPQTRMVALAMPNKHADSRQGELSGSGANNSPEIASMLQVLGHVHAP
jgi:hypothetical protein